MLSTNPINHAYPGKPQNIRFEHEGRQTKELGRKEGGYKGRKVCRFMLIGMSHGIFDESVELARDAIVSHRAHFNSIASHCIALHLRCVVLALHCTKPPFFSIPLPC